MTFRERIAELDQDRSDTPITKAWLLDNLKAAEAALKKIERYSRLPMVDMTDPPEDQARDWSRVARAMWELARDALAKLGDV